MTVLYRKAIKLCFTIICAITVAFMMGYWIYKYEVEDRDIGVVDYVALRDGEAVKVPDVSLCIQQPFIVSKLKAINSNITAQKYREYLAGDRYEKIYEEIDYANVTLDLNQYLNYAETMWHNGTFEPIFSDSIKYIETFNGFGSNGISILKCFTMRSNVKDLRKVKVVTVNLDKSRMKSDLAADMELSLVVHYPSQFFLLKILEQRSVFLEQVAITNLFIEKLEIIKQRNSRNRKCSNDVDNYDKTIVDDVIHKTGCRPPYIKLPQSFPKCKTQKEIAVGKIDMLTRTRVRIPDACHRITEVRQNVIVPEISDII